MKHRAYIALTFLILIGGIGSLTSCSKTPSTGTGNNVSRSAQTTTVNKARIDAAQPSRNDTATVDNIVINISASEVLRGDNTYPKRLPQVIAVDKPPAKDEVLGWFAPLTAVDDSETPPSLFYPAGSRWFLVDSTGARRGKVSIDRFGTIHYLRIGSGDDAMPTRFRIRDANALVKDYISSHGGLPEDKLILTGKFREGAPDTHMAAVYVAGFSHQFRGFKIHDDIIEAGITKLYGAHYVRRWHKFKAHGKKRPLLDADTLAQAIIDKYQKLWLNDPQKYSDILSGKQLVYIDFERLVYFDPRPRDPKRFADTPAIYHPGWITKVRVMQADIDGFSNGDSLYSFQELVDIGVPVLIVDAHSGKIFVSKPKGDNMFK